MRTSVESCFGVGVFVFFFLCHMMGVELFSDCFGLWLLLLLLVFLLWLLLWLLWGFLQLFRGPGSKTKEEKCETAAYSEGFGW